MPVSVQSLDHLVLTVADIAVTCDFYETILGMRAERFTPSTGPQRWALVFGNQKINLHEAGAEFEPKAHKATPGSADLCFVSETRIAVWQAHLEERNIPVEAGPVRRTGAVGPILSVYIRDPDNNLIEIANQL